MPFKSLHYKQSSALQCSQEDLYLGGTNTAQTYGPHPIQMSIDEMRNTHLKTAKFLLWPEKKDGLQE